MTYHPIPRQKIQYQDKTKHQYNLKQTSQLNNSVCNNPIHIQTCKLMWISRYPILKTSNLQKQFLGSTVTSKIKGHQDKRSNLLGMENLSYGQESLHYRQSLVKKLVKTKLLQSMYQKNGAW